MISKLTVLALSTLLLATTTMGPRTPEEDAGRTPPPRQLAQSSACVEACTEQYEICHANCTDDLTCASECRKQRMECMKGCR